VSRISQVDLSVVLSSRLVSFAIYIKVSNIIVLTLSSRRNSSLTLLVYRTKLVKKDRNLSVIRYRES
jgi:hypothetical protein